MAKISTNTLVISNAFIFKTSKRASTSFVIQESFIQKVTFFDTFLGLCSDNVREKVQLEYFLNYFEIGNFLTTSFKFLRKLFFLINAFKSTCPWFLNTMIFQNGYNLSFSQFRQVLWKVKTSQNLLHNRVNKQRTF